MTSSSERLIRPDYEHKVPRSPDEFAAVWKDSAAGEALLAEHHIYTKAHPFDGHDILKFFTSRKASKSKYQRRRSPFTISYPQQIMLNIWRSVVLLRTDPSLPITLLISNFIEALIVSSIFYNLPDTTDSFRQRSMLLFFMILINSFSSALEILTLYAKRRVIEKHARYALYHPSADALGSMIVDLPYKIINAILINCILYFMGNLRREPGPFFFFLLINFTLALVMSMLFRLIGSVTKSIEQALAPAATSLFVLIMYCGFTIPQRYMPAWLAWTRHANPLFYGFESVMINEFAGRDFTCLTLVPQGAGYDSVGGDSATACSVPGAVPGRTTVAGTDYISEAFGFGVAHRWRNLGLLFALMVGYLALHLVAIEYITSERSRGEVLVFSAAEKRTRRKMEENMHKDIETGIAESTWDQRDHSSTGDDELSSVDRQTSIFHWRNVSYEIPVKGGQRQLLDQIDGWIKPGTLTALMVR